LRPRCPGFDVGAAVRTYQSFAAPGVPPVHKGVFLEQSEAVSRGALRRDNPELITAETRERSGWFEKGHLLRLVLDTLRAVPEPVAIRQISLPRVPITSAAMTD
jgi:hypothetical protein